MSSEKKLYTCKSGRAYWIREPQRMAVNAKNFKRLFRENIEPRPRSEADAEELLLELTLRVLAAPE